MRKTVEIPAPGTPLVIPATGKSLIIESMNLYSDVSEVPVFDFSPGVNQYPMYPRSVYANEKGYKEIRLQGTVESEGDEVTILTTNQCLKTNLNINYSESYDSTPGTTTPELLEGTEVFQFNELAIQNSEGYLPKRVYLNSLDNPILYAFNTNPNQADPANCHILPPPDANFENETDL